MKSPSPRCLIAIIFMMVLVGCGSFSAVQDGAPTRKLNVARIPNAVPKVLPHSKTGNPSSYVVYGKRYFVKKSAEGFNKKGIASWYGTKFHGRKTSSGEPYDLYGMTAAMRTIPIPTFVEVTNLANHRDVIVKVNDRGPFDNNRLIDLSYAAATKLDMLRKGTAYVDVRVIDPRVWAKDHSRRQYQRSYQPQSLPQTSPAHSTHPTYSTHPKGEAPVENAFDTPSEAAILRPAAMKSVAPALTPAPSSLQQKIEISFQGGAPVQNAANQNIQLIAQRPAVQHSSRREKSHQKQPRRLQPPKTTLAHSAKTTIQPPAPKPIKGTEDQLEQPHIYLQVGAYTDRLRADQLLTRLRASVKQPTRIEISPDNGAPVYRVQVGPINSVDTSDQVVTALSHAGFNDPMTIIE